MSEFATKSATQGQQEQKIETRTAVKRMADFTIVAIAVAALAILGAVALFAQGKNEDKYSLKSPTILVLRTGRRLRDVSAAVERLRLMGRAPVWAVLVGKRKDQDASTHAQ